MNAVEFQATVHNNMIALPGNQKSWNGKKIKVILLDDSSSDATEISDKKVPTDADFFNCAGIWENRDDVTQESIRAMAWRDNKR